MVTAFVPILLFRIWAIVNERQWSEAEKIVNDYSGILDDDERWRTARVGAMLRVAFTIVLPLLLPTALYLGWVWVVQARDGGGAMRWQALPWVWLAAAGALLLVIVLFVVNVHFGTVAPGTYVPPRWENGHIVPGHIEPKR